MDVVPGKAGSRKVAWYVSAKGLFRVDLMHHPGVAKCKSHRNAVALYLDRVLIAGRWVREPLDQSVKEVAVEMHCSGDVRVVVPPSGPGVRLLRPYNDIFFQLHRWV